MEDLFNRHVAFTSEKFADCSAFHSLLHLEKEVQELQLEHALNEDPAKLKLEIADFVLLLFDFCMRAGVSYADLEAAIKEKITINENRKWVKDSDGHYKHVKP